MPSSDEESWGPPFIDALAAIRQRDDRATLSKLRRGLTDHVAERDVWVFGHMRGAAPQQEDSAMLVASLFAMHPQPGGRGSLGACFRQMRTDTTADSLDKRFTVLLDSHPDELPHRLRQAISLLKAKEIPVDWLQLLMDLLRWQSELRIVQRRWARDYWTTRSTPDDEMQDTRPTTTVKE